MRAVRLASAFLIASLALVGCASDTAPIADPADDKGSRDDDAPRAPSRPTTTPTAEVPEADELTVVNSGFGQNSYDDTTWWYVVVINNPNAEWLFDFAEVTIEAVGADGTILDSTSDYLTILPGDVAVSGTLFDVGTAEIDHLDVRGPVADDAESAPDDGLGAFAVSEISSTTNEYSTSVSGILTSTFAAEQENVEVVVVATAPTGAIIGAEFTYVDRLPVEGRAQFEVTFLDPLPADTGYAAYPTL